MFENLILVGLGNPGARYESTRHNLGFVVVDAIARRHRLEWKPAGPARSYQRANLELSSVRVVLLKPQTYMNLSGDAIIEFRASTPFRSQDLLVVVDDIALPLGSLRLRKQGSDGGHNGLGSIIESIGTTRFPRLRLGVGPVPAEMDPADFVLEPFLDDEMDVARRMIRAAVRCVDAVVSDGYERAMGRFNTVPGDSESG
ncbi:MAG: aminoacyl-tRNA hydrolase [Candidatus Latescibacterota bacterium]|nr:MAG: aminoacyl-tRNA hydrolase [Candidatus Latescibacterota bacterium]